MRASSIVHVLECPWSLGPEVLLFFCLFYPSRSIHPLSGLAPEKRGRHGVVLKQDNHSLMLEGVKARVPGGLEGAGRIQ